MYKIVELVAADFFRRHEMKLTNALLLLSTSKTMELIWAIFFLVGFLIIFRLKAEGKISEKVFRIAVTVLQGVGAIISTVYASDASKNFYRMMEHAFEWVVHKVGLELTQLLVAAAITGIGVSAYWFKVKTKKWYGRVEVIVGFLSAVFVAGSLGPNKLDLAKWSTLAGCAYVIARGLGNYYDAKKEEIEKALAAQKAIPANI
jgi:hypothetical protein